VVALTCQISSFLLLASWPVNRLRVGLKAIGAKGNIGHGIVEEIPSHQLDHLYSVQVQNQDIYADVDGSLVPFVFGVTGSRTTLTFDRDMGGGLFVNLTFPRSSSQHDTLVGRLPGISNIMCHSRIKRWWMAPFFPENVDAVPIETQLLLLETPIGIPTTTDLQVGLLRPSNASTNKNSPGMMYSVIMPLVDYNTGFRTTLYGWNEGGPPAGDGVLVARSESGDEVVTSSKVPNALFIAAGKDPYKLLDYAFRSVSGKMGTFKVRTEKPPIPGFDGFGYCTWDAFYSSVDSDKIESAVTSLRNIGVPPKFVIIDDGWQSTANMGDKRESAEKVKDGELSGAQIDGSLAADRLVKESYDGNIISKSIAKIVGCATKLVTQFYTEVVEKAPPDDWSVKIWTLISQTVIKDVLIDFFASQTDFSKRLTSWKANIKFEDTRTGKSLKQFITRLKSDMGVEKVFVWHALGGYWGGISTESKDDFPKEFARNTEMGYVF
jgi:raffinose synthase